MKKLVLGTLLLVAGLAKAQAPTYDDLRILFADGNYEKLIRSSEHYTNSDKTKNDPLPHMWLARGLYKMSQSGTDDEKYKNAYKEAINSIGKAIKYDKSGEVQSEYAEFFTEFRTSMVELIRNDVEDTKVKSSGWVVKYYKLDVNSVGAKYLEGVFKFRSNDKSGANTAWKDAEARLAKVTSIENWGKADVELLKIGVLQTAAAYISMKQTEKAKTLLGKVKQWFEEDEEFMAKYDEIVN